MFGFFFFKQKTAYELRISDWSSDVCSSDLFRPWHRPVLHKYPAHYPAARPVTRTGQAWEEIWQAFRASWPGKQAEIGRASCRERVVSVRVDLGGRRILKKKKTRKC